MEQLQAAASDMCRLHVQRFSGRKRCVNVCIAVSSWHSGRCCAQVEGAEAEA